MGQWTQELQLFFERHGYTTEYDLNRYFMKKIFMV